MGVGSKNGGRRRMGRKGKAESAGANEERAITTYRRKEERFLKPWPEEKQYSEGWGVRQSRPKLVEGGIIKA